MSKRKTQITSRRNDGLDVFESDPELRGPVEPLDGRDGERASHVGFIYETGEEQFATVAPYVREGLERGEKCTYLFAENAEEEVLSALRDRGVDVDAALESGQLSLRPVEEAYLDGGEFDADRALSFLRSALQDCREDYEGLRVTAEETWLRGDESTQEAFMRFEARVNDLFEEEPVAALCQYDRTRLPPEVVEAVIETHPYLVYDGTVCRNVHYTPPSEYFEPDDLSRENGRKLETLVDRTDARASLRTRNRFQKRLYDVVSHPHRSFEEKLGALFELGCEFFEMEVGVLARVDREADRLVIEQTSREHEHLRPGAEFDLSETYCTAPVELEGTASVSNAREEGYGDVAVREECGFESYLGSFVDGPDDDRTFFFVSSEPREGITDEEHTLHHLMAQWVENELDRTHRERETELFRNLVDQSNDGVYVIDPETGRYLDVNDTACRRLGCDRDELLQLSIFDVVERFSDPDEWRSYVEGIKSEDGKTCEGAHERKDGTTYPVEVNASFVEQDREYLISIARDITERKERERFHRELYEVTSSSEPSFDEKLDRVLELGSERFGLPYGFLTRIDEDAQTIVHSKGDHELLQPGKSCPLGRTYCRKTIESGGLMAVRKAATEGWEDDPAHEVFGLESYVGASVVVDGELHGTLCFASGEERDRPFTDAERTYLELIGQWVSHELERERREEQLAALNEMSRDLMLAETRSEIATSTVEHARETLRLPLSAVVYYDKQTGTLSPAAQTPRAEEELPIAALCDRESGPLWEAFAADEVRALTDVAIESDEPLGEAVAVPLGQRGLFVTATRRSNGFSDAERNFVETAAATVEAASTRAERQQELQEREETLEEQNDTLERLNRLNTIIRNIDQALVQASTRAEIEEVVCEHLADVGPYELAWVGEFDPVVEEIDHRQWAGAEQGYLEEIATVDDEVTGTGPGGRAIETHEPQVVNDILDDSSFEPWRQAAINRGYHSFIALPLVYEDTRYGLLGVYAGRPGVFDELEQSVLTDMARTIAYAINAVESKKALVGDEVTKLEFTIDDPALEIIELARELDCEFAMESIVPRADGRFRVFFSTQGASAEDVLEFESRLPSTNLTLIAERDEGEEPFGLFESTLEEGSLCATTVEHGGHPCDVRVADGTATVSVELAADADVRKFVEVIQTKYPDSELVSQRTEDRPKRTRMEFSAEVAEALTARQLEVLQTAYYSGYFEEPRQQGAREIAEAMNIAQSTFSSHVRAAHRKVCQHLFDEGSLLS